MLRCVSSPPGSTLSKNDHARKDASAPPASALPECSARPGPAGHAPASAHHAPAARRARTPTASHSHPHGSPQMSHVIPRHVLQTLKSGRCNSNVFRAYQKLTKINYVRVFGEERLPPAREITAHPHGSPQMSHVIPLHVFQTLKSGRCNSNVFSAHQKLTEGNYVRLFGEERLPPADEAGAGSALTTSVRQPLGLLRQDSKPRVDDLKAVGLVGLVVEVLTLVVPDAVVLVEAGPGLVPGPER